MNTNSLKRFATAARSMLMHGVRSRLRAVGFDEDGTVRETPHAVDGGVMLGSALVADPHFLPRWEALRHRIEAHGVKNVVEEAAYTWFNRLMALRILTRNGLAPAVLDYANPDIRLPRIVTDARAGKTPILSADDRAALDRIILDGRLAFEQFSILIRAVCENNAIIRNCFGGITDYTMLLLPTDILAECNFIDLLNDTDSFISADEWRKPELIGWLYQFYISEKKDEVFAKKGGYDSDEIPAATQIFTPNWIVKYMVENTLGRIYIDNNPDSPLAKDWKYLVVPAEPDTSSLLPITSLEELKCADLSCGSGHILNEMFDLLLQLYTDDFYSPREAIEAIFTKNMVGIDLDIRARQLAQFALLLKACQTDSAFANGHCMPRIYSFPEISAEQWRDYHGDIVKAYSIVAPSQQVFDEIEKACELMEDADALGSIMKFDLSDATRVFIKKVIEAYEASPRTIQPFGEPHSNQYGHVTEAYIIPDESEDAQYSKTFRPLIDALRIMLALTDKYAAICMNPPYMAPSKVKKLKDYCTKNYPHTKTDLFAVFMEVATDRLLENGKYAMINLPSWMFLSSFEDLRKSIIEGQHIDSLIHMGRGIFGIDWGSVAFCITNSSESADSVFFRLHKRNFQHIYYYHIQELFLRAKDNHGLKYDFDTYREDGEITPNIEFNHSEKGIQLYYELGQKQFEQIPGAPIAYWASPTAISAFNNILIDEIGDVVQGMIPGNVPEFVRFWYEVSQNKIGTTAKKGSDINASGKKWFYYNKGGGFRKWYGNIEHVLNMENDGYDIKFSGLNNNYRLRDPKYYFKEAVTWSKIGSTMLSTRYMPSGCLFDIAGCCIFFLHTKLNQVLAFTNTKVAETIIGYLSPTLNFEVEHIKGLPIIEVPGIDDTVSDCISISKEDWDAHETSWDFATNPLLAVDMETYLGNIDWAIEKHRRKTGEEICIDPAAPELDSLRWRYNQYCEKWESLFDRLHRNEEELNRRFIEIYGLQDELKPNVPLKEVTILQQGEIKVVDEAAIELEDGSGLLETEDGKILTIGIEPKIKWQQDVVIKQFISYAIGCMMGRYRLDCPGLAIAHPNPSEEELAEYIVPQTGEKWWIDDDGIVPMMSADSPFHDNAANRFSEFVRVALGNEKHTDNMNFIRECLGKDVVEYLRNDFYADHKRMYQNRPIYWLFSSNQKGKQAAFQCLVYMHRMDRFTPEHIRTNYLLPYIDHLAAREAELMAKSSLTTKEGKELKQLRSDLEECRDYQLRLHAFADQQIAIDLDDGVVKNYAIFAPVLAKLK